VRVRARRIGRDQNAISSPQSVQRSEKCSGVFLQSPVCGINLHEVNVEKKLPAKLEARRASEERRGCFVSRYHILGC